MNRDQFEGNFKQLRGKIKEKWGVLTDDEITQINGKFDQLAGKLQQKYGYTKEKVEEEIRNWNPQTKPQPEGREKIKSR